MITIASVFFSICMAAFSLTLQLPIGTEWKTVAETYGKPVEDAPWGKGGRLYIFKQEDRELQVYLDRENKVEGVFTLYPDGIVLGKRPELLEQLTGGDGFFVKMVDEKDEKVIRFKGMAYIQTDKKANVSKFLLTAPKQGYQYLYLEASFRANNIRQFNRQIVEQARAKLRWNENQVRR